LFPEMTFDAPEAAYSGTPMVSGLADNGDKMMVDLGPPAIPYAAIILLLLGLKYLSESNLLSFEPAEVKVSTFNILNIGLQSVAFILALKLAAAYMLQNNIRVPGLNDLVGAI
jgi:hypothetical protein